MAKSPPSPFPGTQCCFPLTNYLSSPLQTHSFAQFCTNARLQVQPVQRACNALRKWQTFRFEAVFCIYNHSHPVFHPCILLYSWSLHVVCFPQAVAFPMMPGHDHTSLLDDTVMISDSSKQMETLLSLHVHMHILRDITRPISREILWLFCGNIVASAPILARYHCGRTRSYCVTSLDRSSQKAFSLKQQVFAAWRRDYANVDRLHSGQRLKAMIVDLTENSRI